MTTDCGRTKSLVTLSHGETVRLKSSICWNFGRLKKALKSYIRHTVLVRHTHRLKHLKSTLKVLVTLTEKTLTLSKVRVKKELNSMNQVELSNSEHVHQAVVLVRDLTCLSLMKHKSTPPSKNQRLNTR